MTGVQTQLEQSRLQEAELLGALKEMQDKVLDLEKVSSANLNLSQISVASLT